MRGLLLSITVFVLGLVPSASADGLTVRTTTRMLSDPLAFLFEGQAEVIALLGAGTDPHTYQPTRTDVRQLAEADGIVYHGLFFEAQLLGLMEQLERRKPVYAGSEFQPEDALLFVEGFEDPHTWHNPIFWTATVVDLAQALAGDLDLELPEARIALLQQAAQLTDAWIEQSFAPVPREQRIIVSAHDAFSYYGQRYGLTLEPLLGLSTASETKLTRVNELVALIAERNISAVFSETSVESAGIAALREGAARNGVTLRSLPPLFSDALGPQGEAGSTYFGMLIENTINMVDAVSGERPELSPDLEAFLASHGLLTTEKS
jgi:manganese/zinc/iron transport system substrate-binding protein